MGGCIANGVGIIALGTLCIMFPPLILVFIILWAFS
jgi:hypothetical protein